MNSLIFHNQPKAATGAVGPFALTSNPRNEALGGVRILLQSPVQAAAYQAYGAKLLDDAQQVTSSGPGLAKVEKWTVEKLVNTLTGQARDAFAKLTAAQRGQFVQLLNAYSADSEQGLPYDLFELLTSGKLVQKDSKNGTLLDSLAKLSTQELASGLDRTKILQELVQRINLPELIRQGQKDTCTATAMEYALAAKKPAEFARLVTGLVSHSGFVRLADGNNISRDGGCLKEDGSGRAGVDRIFQATMMEFANGSLCNYNNEKNRNELAGIVPGGSGLSGGEVEDGLESLYNKDYDTYKYKDGDASKRSATVKRFQRAMAAGHQAFVGLHWYTYKDGSKGMHQLVLTSITETSVQLWNPQGADEDGGLSDGRPRRQHTPSAPVGHTTMNVADFFSRLDTFHLPDGY